MRLSTQNANYEVQNAHPCLQALQSSSEVRKLRRRDQNHVEFLHHNARELEVFLLLENLGKRPVYPFGIQVEA